MSHSKRGLMSPSPSTSPTNPFLSASASPSSQNLLSESFSNQSHSAAKPNKLARSPPSAFYSSQSPTASRPLLSQSPSAPFLSSSGTSGRPSPGGGYSSSTPRIGVTSPSPGSTPSGMPITPGREGPPISFPHFQTPALQRQDEFGQIRKQSSFPSRPSTNQSNTSGSGGFGKRVSDDSSLRSDSPHVMGNPFSDPTLYTPSPSGSSRGGLSSKFALHPDPSMWGYDVSPKSIEDDDWLHRPDKNMDKTGTFFTWRGCQTIGFMLLLALGLMGLFLGFPVTSAILRKSMSTNGGYNLGGINSTGQIMEGVFSLIDKDTDQSFYTKASPVDGKTMQLVFSDEFNTEGRSFYPGDDPFWEAVDLYYWGTRDLEWYDPQQITTKDGKLVITFEAQENHNVSYLGGMLSTWNKFCFTGGLIETSVQLPGSNQISGYWPAVWTMGNLGRAGYGASTDGLWPYSYEACDVGTLANQTHGGVPDVQGLQLGDQAYDYDLSFLPGQRLSACTCPGEDHPGPKYKDGSFKGRMAPEIDIFEAQIDSALASGAVSQSCQFAPYNAYYSWDNTTFGDFLLPGEQEINGFKGNVYQQSTSVVSKTNQRCYEVPSDGGTPCYSVYGFQYKPGYEADNAFITWIDDDKLSWTLHAGGVGKDDVAQISARAIPQEPMYIIANLGMSPGFSNIEFEALPMPAHMSIDYVRVYQYQDQINYGCDPEGYPTSNYINRFIESYTNPNITTWSNPPEEGGYGQAWPKNKLIDQC